MTKTANDPRATKLLFPKPAAALLSAKVRPKDPLPTEPAEPVNSGNLYHPGNPAPPARRFGASLLQPKQTPDQAQPPKPTLSRETIEARAAQIDADRLAGKPDDDGIPFDVPTPGGKFITVKVKAPTDWEAVEAIYRTGVMRDVDLARRFGCHKSTLCNKAKEKGWTRDKRSTVIREALALDESTPLPDALRERKQAPKTPKTGANDGVSTNEQPGFHAVVRVEQTPIVSTTEAVLIETLAHAIARTRMEHRVSLRASRDLMDRLFEDVSLMVTQRDALRNLGQLMEAPDDKGIDKLNELYHEIIAFPGNVKAFKDLVEAQYKVIGMERDAYRLEEPETDPNGRSRSIGIRFVDAVVKQDPAPDALEPLKKLGDASAAAGKGDD